jgi:hypothetical protein
LGNQRCSPGFSQIDRAGIPADPIASLSSSISGR